MFKLIQNYINFSIVCLIASNVCFTQVPGCTDPEAYNCDDSIAGEYINEIGAIVYNYSCDGNSDHAGSEDCSAGEICEGYYNPAADTDDGSCRYPQAPHGTDVMFNVTSTAINVNWSTFTPPTNATLVSYHAQRCVDDGCTWIDGFTPSDENTSTLFSDDYDFEIDEQIKYAIAVKYSNNPYWGWAIGASYIYPPDIGDVNGDGFFNVQDIVILANCVLSVDCDDITFSYAGDMNGDGFFNVQDIVILANCVLSQSCSN